MSTESVKVIVRCRPILELETRAKCRTIVSVDKGMQQVHLMDPQDEDMLTAKTFRFDEVFDSVATQ